MSVPSKALQFAALLGLVTGCAVGGPAAVDSDYPADQSPTARPFDISSDDGQEMLDRVVREDATNPILQVQQLAELGDTGISIGLGQGEGITQLTLRPDTVEPGYQVKAIANPPRLVVDLTGQKGQSNRDLSIADDPFLTGVRIGAHTDKARVVLDLSEFAATGASVDQQIDSQGSLLTVTFIDRNVLPANSELGPLANESELPEPTLELDAETLALSSEEGMPEAADPVELASAEVESSREIVPAQDISAASRP